ncbi:hypothetical protein [Streptomyces sp. NBC_00239]|uniref:hypothetical protein n=1 Tax=Streptomyces sp. NBC_00239 TaxID=2903640 RepID=UPI002E2BB285|nr:hypothetical protein [Streptomyces sp. NBC_00239]
MRVTRRTARTAAVAAGALAVLAFPAGAAFADSTGSPAPQAAPGADRPAQPDEQGNPDEQAKPDEQAEPDGTERDEQNKNTDEQKKDESGRKDETGQKDKSTLRSFVTTVKLADGSVAKVYSFGDEHFEAEILAAGAKLDTLVSKGGEPAYGQHNGLHVVLQPNGTVTSWIEGGDKKDESGKDESKKPRPKQDENRRQASSVRITLPDGRIAKLVKGGSAGPRVEISMPNGSFLGAVDLKHPSTVNDGWTYKLVMDGKVATFVVIDGKHGGSSRVYAFDGRLIEKYDVQRDGRHRDHRKATGDARTTAKAADGTAAADRHVMPRGGVKAGAEGVETGSSEAPVLLAAGGGMAAVGAAGLGFALLRRGRNQQG